MRKLIIVEGLPCSGKSTTARYIAEQLDMTYIDEGSGCHPADYEFHAYITCDELKSFTPRQQSRILNCAEKKQGGYIVPIGSFEGELAEKLISRKIYDFLPWETEYPLMLDKWKEFAGTIGSRRYVFNCVLLQNPMCETMMRFNYDISVSAGYIGRIWDIIAPLEPFVVYLRTEDIRAAVEAAAPARGEEWLSGVIDYHCNGAYGRAHGLSGMDGYIEALAERQHRETEILKSLGADHIIIEASQKDWEKTYKDIMSAI